MILAISLGCTHGVVEIERVLQLGEIVRLVEFYTLAGSIRRLGSAEFVDYQ